MWLCYLYPSLLAKCNAHVMLFTLASMLLSGTISHVKFLLLKHFDVRRSEPGCSGAAVVQEAIDYVRSLVPRLKSRQSWVQLCNSRPRGDAAP